MKIQLTEVTVEADGSVFYDFQNVRKDGTPERISVRDRDGGGVGNDTAYIVGKKAQPVRDRELLQEIQAQTKRFRAELFGEVARASFAIRGAERFPVQGGTHFVCDRGVNEMVCVEGGQRSESLQARVGTDGRGNKVTGYDVDSDGRDDAFVFTTRTDIKVVVRSVEPIDGDDIVERWADYRGELSAHGTLKTCEAQGELVAREDKLIKLRRSGEATPDEMQALERTPADHKAFAANADQLIAKGDMETCAQVMGCDPLVGKRVYQFPDTISASTQRLLDYFND